MKKMYLNPHCILFSLNQIHLMPLSPPELGIHFITSVLFKYLRRKLRICYSLSCESNFLRKERTKETGQITQETALVVNLGCCILKQKGVFFFLQLFVQRLVATLRYPNILLKLLFSIYCGGNLDCGEKF